MIGRVAAFTLSYWPPVLLILLSNVLGDCGASGEAEIRCPMARTHLTLAVAFSLGLFAGGFLVVALKPRSSALRFGATIMGIGLAVLFIGAYMVAGWTIHSL